MGDVMIDRDQFFALARNLRWIIVLSLALSALLVVPDQILELYRIAAGDIGRAAVKEFLGFSAIALMIWLGAFQLTTASLPANATNHFGLYKLAPIVLGALPLLAATIGQVVALPKEVGTDDVGSIFRIEDQALTFDRHVLWLLTVACGGLLIGFVDFGRRMGASEGITRISRKANVTYFQKNGFVALTALIVAALTAAFIAFPDTLAQSVGTIGVIALFTISVVSITIHITLWTIKRGIPLLPLVFGSLAALTALSGCDDHELRPPAGPLASDGRMSAASAFHGWLTQPSRIAEAARLGRYPVFIVTAQGGGIYAAHNAARFLSRMQDLCPGFRQHLFAISSVSGGSVGAATFAAALHADDVLPNGKPVSGQQTCDLIAQFLAGTAHAQDLDVPGSIERRVASVLKTDFVSPLAAGFLFSDFTQLFVPFPVRFFDRARFLEYTFENAGDGMLNSSKAISGLPNLLRADFQSHWTPDNNMPALLLNTTDVGSGKRVVISPFDIDPTHPKDANLCTLARLTRSKDDATVVTSQTIHMPLSAAAFASARFPWVTPAATVTLTNDCITANPRARLVDGGYVENSGIETALDLIKQVKDLAHEKPDLPKSDIYLLSLANKDFDDHGRFWFGELMEPIRAMFSTQSSRTSIALNRAKDSDLLKADDGTSAPLPSFGRTDITGLFYSLPLGWTLSEKTSEIISLSSGRFWDCSPSNTLEQARPKQSQSDCLQVKVYHLLNGDVTAAVDTIGRFNGIERQLKKQLAKPSEIKAKVDAQRLLACYEVSALLQEWDRVEETDPKILAYLLGSVSHDSLDFTRTSENLWFRRASQIPDGWLARLNDSNAKLAASGKPVVDINALLRNPHAFANAVFGYEDNKFGNQPGTDDGWNFRLRGMYQLVGRQQYQEAQTQLQQLGQQLPDLDLTTEKGADALWDAKIAAKVTFAHFRLHKYSGRTLFDLLKDKSLDWKAVRSLQTDMAKDSDQKDVDLRSQMFKNCINDVSNPSTTENWVNLFTGEQ
jgi:predicted chitinase